MSYLTYSFNLTENQKKKLAIAYNNKKAVNIKFKFNHLTGDFPIMITKRQQNKINKAKKENVGFVLRMSESQVRKQSQNEDFLCALAGLLTRTILPLAGKFIPKIIAPLATGSLRTVGDVAMKKIMGNGMISVPNDKKIDLLKTNALTNTQIHKLKNSPCECELKLTNKQMQNGGFLGLLASLGIPLISSLIGSLMGKGLQLEPPRGRGLQIDSAPRSYRRIPVTAGDGLQIDSEHRNYKMILPNGRTRAAKGLRYLFIEGDGMQKKDKIC